MVRSADPRRQRLQKLFSIFPDGWPGVALVILRIAVALNAVAQGVCALMGSSRTMTSVWTLGLLAIIAGVVLLAGFATPIVGGALTLGYFIESVAFFFASDASKHASALTALYIAAMSFALVLLGPGAISVDARLFGRQEIIIPDGRRPPR